MSSPRFLVLVAVLALCAYVVPAAAATGSRAPTTSPALAGEPATAATRTVLRVSGAVSTPGRLSLDDLRALPQQSVTTTYTSAGVPTTKTFTGPLLLDVVNASGPRFDPADKNDSLSFVVRAHATDGYRAVVAWGEIDPGFANKQVLVAVTEDGAALTRPRLVVPGDARGGRYVSDLDDLRVLDLG